MSGIILMNDILEKESIKFISLIILPKFLNLSEKNKSAYQIKVDGVQFLSNAGILVTLVCL